MRTIVVLSVLFLFIAGAPIAFSQDSSREDPDRPPATVPDTQTIAFTSEHTGQDYRLSVALPASYNTSEQSYPVLYLLDPVASFLSVTEFVRFMAWVPGNQLPELIVVGIGYPTDDINETLGPRERDYHYFKSQFMEFVSEELFPLIDSTYRTDSTDRALVGFSLGGEFVFYTLVSKPELFNRYIAIGSLSQEGLPSLLLRDDVAFRESFVGLNLKFFHATPRDEILSIAIQRREYDGLEAIGLSMGNITDAAAVHLGLPAGILAIYQR
jgi:hypothetical protein